MSLDPADLIVSKALLWLANAHRNGDVAVPDAPGGVAQLLANTQRNWPVFHDFELEYEPRCLVVRGDNNALAVGTKAGFIHVVTLDPVTRVWKPSILKGLPDRAVRAAVFLDDETMVVGQGHAALVEVSLSGTPPREIPLRGKTRATGKAAKFRRLILAAESRLVYALTAGGELFAVRRTSRGISGDAVDPRSLFPSISGAIVDLAFQGPYLWGLDAQGRIHRSGGRDMFDHAVPSVIPTPMRAGSGDFIGLASCPLGLALLRSDAVCFMGFALGADGLPMVSPATTEWASVKNCLECAVVVQKVPQSKPESLLDEKVWTVVATKEPHLAWTEWKKSSDEWKPRNRLRTLSFGSRAAVNPLHVCFAGNESEGTAVIAYATRHHHLRIASLTGPQTRCVLDARLPKVLEHARAQGSKENLLDVPGVGLWFAEQRIAFEFGIHMPDEIRSLVDSVPEPELRCLDRSDLLRLTDHLLECWLLQFTSSSALVEDRDSIARRRAVVESWVRRILRHSFEINSGAPGEERLARVIGRRINEQIQGPTLDDAGMLRRKELGELAKNLRKWVVFGFTYGEKKTGLYRLHRWNQKRKVDALTYLTRLLGQRVDLLWEASLCRGEVRSPIWDIAQNAGRTILVASQTDGGIRALSSEGSPLRWRVETHAMEELEKTGLAIDADGQRLRHGLLDEFHQKYYHGPYARSLRFLQPAQDLDILLFPMKGFRDTDREGDVRRSPRLCALAVALDKCSSEVVIKAADAKDVDSELYGIEVLKESSDGFSILVGTSGVVGSTARSFLEASVTLQGASDRRLLSLNIRDIPVQLSTRGVRSSPLWREACHNPCWALAVVPNSECVWAGFHDGSLRCFRRFDADGWIERGGGRSECSGCVYSSKSPPTLGASSPIWTLEYHQEANDRWLAYGAANGVVGALPLTDGGNAWVHRVHTRHQSPICGIGHFVDDGHQRLLAVSQDGSASLFSVSVDGEAGGIPGRRLDHFGLEGSARALVTWSGTDSADPDEPASLPGFIVGTGDGMIRRFALTFPAGSVRTVTAESMAGTLVHEIVQDTKLWAPGKAPSETQSSVLEWLRVMDVDGPQLQRAALGHDLRQQAASVLTALERLETGACDVQRVLDEVDETLETYKERLRALAEDVYRRVPVDKQSIKVLYQQGAFVAAELSRVAVEKAADPDLEVSRLLVRQYRELHIRVDELCNHWIGLEQSQEAKVLISVFKALATAHDMVMLAIGEPKTRETKEFRSFLLKNVLRKRLAYMDALVPTETLRVLNVNLYGAVLAVGKNHDRRPYSELALRPQDSTPGFYDLMVMVGDLAERHSETLLVSHPMATEICRFFALTLLLIPDSSLHVGQVVSESRLIEHGSRLAGAIAEQARSYRNILAKQGDWRASRWDEEISRFTDYLSDSADLGLRRDVTDLGTPWRRLVNSRADRQDADIQVEMKHALFIAAGLTALNHDGLEGLDESVDWLEGTRARYFGHSQQYLKKLRYRRSKILEAQQNRSGNAIRWLEEGLEELAKADLFEPQRAQYRQIINNWRYQIESAWIPLNLDDKLNRHISRKSADELMAYLTEFAVQTVPVLPPESSPPRVYRRHLADALRDHRVAHGLFDKGMLLVEQAALMWDLLELVRPNASDSAFGDGSMTCIDEWNDILSRCASVAGLGRPVVLGEVDGPPLPGSRATWDAILGEFSRNVHEHRPADMKAEIRVAYHWSNTDVPAGGRTILVSGNYPFVHAAERNDDTLRRFSSDEAKWTRLRELLQNHTELPWMLASSRGFGLRLIVGLCRRLHIKTPVDIFDAHLPLGTELPVRERLQWPLCLRVNWENLEAESHA